MNDQKSSHRWSAALLAGLILVLLTAGVAWAAGNVTGYAWGTNVGWINFNPANGGVTVYSDHLEGDAWAENIGWIRLGTYEGGGAHTYANDAAGTYGVNNDGDGDLSGYAWSTNAGWINFAPENGGVTIDQTRAISTAMPGAKTWAGFISRTMTPPTKSTPPGTPTSRRRPTQGRTGP